MLATILLVILVALLLGTLPVRDGMRDLGYGPSGLVGVVLIVILLLLLLGRI